MSRKPVLPAVTFSETGGVRSLHFGTEWIQGSMRLSRPEALELEYARQMMGWLLFLDPAAHARPPFAVAQLGLGTGALTKFCHRQFPAAKVTAVELNPAVIVAARSMFLLPPDNARLRVLQMDAWDFVRDPDNAGALDALQIDLYDATARGPVLDSLAFYKACRACLRAPGVLTINLFGDHDSYARNIERLRKAFDGRVLVLPEVHDGNVVALAFNGPPLSVGLARLRERAAQVKAQTGLNAASWVAGLCKANGFDGVLHV